MKWKSFVRVLPGIVVTFLLLTGCENPADGGDTVITDPGLYYSWGSPCQSAGSDWHQIDMTIDSDGSFERIERDYGTDDTCVTVIATDTIISTFTLHGPTASDETIKQLQYLDNSSATVFALYQVTGTSLEIAEDPAGYPADLTGALNMSR